MSEQDLLRDLSAPAFGRDRNGGPSTRVCPGGTIVFDEGDAADGLYFVGAGQVIADVRVPGHRGRRRLSSIPAGSAFGELALVDGRPRSTRIVAIEPTICHVLSPTASPTCGHGRPDAAAELVLAIARSLSQRLRTSTIEVATMEGI